MEEIIVRLARALASRPRLRLLSLLVQQGEQPPTRLASVLQLPLNVVSTHLRVLVTAGLVTRRKSGAWCYYRAESPYDATTVSGRLAAWLRTVLHTPSPAQRHHPGLHEVRDVAQNPTEVLYGTIFEAATAFTDLRRLQVLRYLSRQRSAGALDLREALSMSAPALSRQMRKLIRRGYVQPLSAGHALAYALTATAKTPLHRRMFDIVQLSWVPAPSRTS